MITTRYGEKIDFADENLEYDGKNYSFRDLSILKNIYEQITTAEFLMENYKLSEDRAWVTAGLVREKMDKNELSEEAAIEETMAESQIMDGFDLASIVKKTKIAPQELYELTNYYKKMLKQKISNPIFSEDGAKKDVLMNMVKVGLSDERINIICGGMKEHIDFSKDVKPLLKSDIVREIRNNTVAVNSKAMNR